MNDVRLERLRDGAFRWELYHNLKEPGIYQELFVLESWAEHERQHSRVTVAYKEIEARTRSFILENKPPVVTHSVAERVEK